MHGGFSNIGYLKLWWIPCCLYTCSNSCLLMPMVLFWDLPQLADPVSTELWTLFHNSSVRFQPCSKVFYHFLSFCGVVEGHSLFSLVLCVRLLPNGASPTQVTQPQPLPSNFPTPIQPYGCYVFSSLILNSFPFNSILFICLPPAPGQSPCWGAGGLVPLESCDLSQFCVGVPCPMVVSPLLGVHPHQGELHA